MRSSKIFIIGLSLVLVSNLVYAYNWPFANPNEQVPITGTFGELRLENNQFHHFHRGIDLGMPVETPVYSVKNGQVAFKAKGSNFWVIYPGTPMGEHYLHLKNQPTHLEKGDPVYAVGTTACQSIGNVNGNHLHFEQVWYELDSEGKANKIVWWDNPLAPGGLGATNTSGYGFRDNVLPIINDVRFYRNKDEWRIFNEKRLFGKVDICVEAYDRRIAANGNAESEGGLGVKRVTCKIYDLWNSLDPFLQNLLFNDKPVSEILSSTDIHCLSTVYWNEIYFSREILGSNLEKRI